MPDTTDPTDPIVTIVAEQFVVGQRDGAPLVLELDDYALLEGEPGVVRRTDVSVQDEFREFQVSPPSVDGDAHTDPISVKYRRCVISRSYEFGAMDPDSAHEIVEWGGANHVALSGRLDGGRWTYVCSSVTRGPWEYCPRGAE